MPVAFATQLPLLPAVLQFPHAPHGPSQHTPSTQVVLWHSAPTVQAVPLLPLEKPVSVAVPKTPPAPVTRSVAVWVPAPVGLKMTLKVQVEMPTRLTVLHWSVAVGTPNDELAGPLMVSTRFPVGPPTVFLTVNCCAGPLCPSTSGLQTKLGGIKDKVCIPLGALLALGDALTLKLPALLAPAEEPSQDAEVASPLALGPEELDRGWALVPDCG